MSLLIFFAGSAGGPPRPVYTYNASGGLFTNYVNLIGRWRFDEGSGTTIIDSSTHHNNGVNNGGTYVNGCPAIKFANPFALNLNGSSFVDIQSLDGFTGLSGLTVSLWANPATIGTKQVLLTGGRGTESGFFQIWIDVDGKVKVTFGPGHN